MGPTSNLDAVDKRKILCLCRKSKACLVARSSFLYRLRNSGSSQLVARVGFHIMQTVGLQLPVSLLVLRAGRALPPRGFLVPTFVKGCVNPRPKVRLEGLSNLKKSSGLIVNQTRVPPVCSTVHQRTTLLLAPGSSFGLKRIIENGQPRKVFLQIGAESFCVPFVIRTQVLLLSRESKGRDKRLSFTNWTAISHSLVSISVVVFLPSVHAFFICPCTAAIW